MENKLRIVLQCFRVFSDEVIRRTKHLLPSVGYYIALIVGMQSRTDRKDDTTKLVCAACRSSSVCVARVCVKENERCQNVLVSFRAKRKAMVGRCSM